MAYRCPCGRGRPSCATVISSGYATARRAEQASTRTSRSDRTRIPTEAAMDFRYTPRVETLREQLREFMDVHILPRIGAWRGAIARGEYPPPFMKDLKRSARAAGLWNLFL